MIDSGIALNCLQEGLVPTQFYEKTKQVLLGANGKKLKIDYKFSKAHIYIKQTFILVRYLKEKVLLGVLFLNSNYPIRVDNKGLITILLDKEILFEFIDPPNDGNIKMLRVQVIRAKENHADFWKQEINLVRNQEQLKIKKTQDAIERFKNKIVREVCFNIFNVFYHRKHHEPELPYEPEFNEKNSLTKEKPI